MKAAVVETDMKLFAVTFVAILGLAACSTGHGTSTGPPSTASRPTGSGPSTTITRPQRFSVRIELPTTSIVAGSTVTGHLVIVNNSGAPLRLLSGGRQGCTPKWAVVLANRKFPAGFAFTSECGAKPLVVRRGMNRFPFELRASYSHCGGTGVQGAVKPACLPPPIVLPPLPADEYHAVFGGSLPGLPKPASVPVRVTAHA